MKKEKEVSNKSVKDYIERITNPIFNKVLQEGLTNSMTITKNPFKILFKPNNYRRQIQVKEKTNSTINYLKKVNSAIRINPHTKLAFLKNYKPNITIQYGRNILTAIYSNQNVYLIERDTISDINVRINEIKLDIEKRLDNALKEFSHKFGVVLPFKKPMWSRHEDFIKGEDYIDKIPRDCIIHDTVFKKVYGKGIEFFGGKDKEPTVHLKNYIKNRALEDIAPDIADSLNQLSLRFDTIGNRIIDMMNNRLKVDNELAINIKTHNKVFKKLDNLLSQKDLRKWL